MSSKEPAMNWLDLALLLVLAWFIISGGVTGLFRETVTLIALVLAVIIAGLVYRELAADIRVMASSERLARVIAFLAIFLAVTGAGQIVSLLLKPAAQTLALGPLNRTGGLAVGLLKGVIVIEVMLFLFARYHFTAMVNAMDGSLLTPIFLRGIPFLLTLLPDEFRQAVDRFPAPL
jgi:membrane protein required for colicin V production